MQPREVIETAIDRGVGLCRSERWEQGLHILAGAFEDGIPSARHAGLAASFLGYGLAMQGNLGDGLRLCLRAAELEYYQPEVHLNRARILLLQNDRSAAIRVLDAGLKIDPDQVQLLELRDQLGARKSPPLPFLSRSHPLNVTFGRLRHRLFGSDERSATTSRG